MDAYNCPRWMEGMKDMGSKTEGNEDGVGPKIDGGDKGFILGI